MILFAAFVVAGVALLVSFIYLSYKDRRDEDAQRYGELFGPVCGVRERLLKSDEYGRLF